MNFLRNLALFFLGFLPLVAILSMVLSYLMADRIPSSAEWDLGWNPVLWFIVTAPWLLPTVLLVPVLHFLGKAAVRRFARPFARVILMMSSVILFMAALLILWGWENFQWDFVLPVVTAAWLYGALLRLPPGSVIE